LNNLLSLKEKLQAALDAITTGKDGSPITNLQINATTATEIEQLIIAIESCNPHPHPLANAIDLLAGFWQLQYSTAREIRSLVNLPLGLKLGQVYQVINVDNKQFFNVAFVQHNWGLLSGYVRVTATFEPALEDSSPVPDKRINVYFDKRFLAIDQIVGVHTPQLNPFKVVSANNPHGRVASLDITYLDENLRIGRGGDDSLFVLQKVDAIPGNTNLI
jgi:hypothetical protein